MSSYWYLKNFPIVDLQNYLDYTTIMTYDFYGVGILVDKMK